MQVSHRPEVAGWVFLWNAGIRAGRCRSAGRPPGWRAELASLRGLLEGSAFPVMGCATGGRFWLAIGGYRCPEVRDDAQEESVVGRAPLGRERFEGVIRGVLVGRGLARRDVASDARLCVALVPVGGALRRRRVWSGDSLVGGRSRVILLRVAEGVVLLEVHESLAFVLLW